MVPVEVFAAGTTNVKLVSFEYPTPIENSFVFSHISYFSGAVVLPTLLIALLALIATIIYGLGMSYFNAWNLMFYNVTPNNNERNSLLTTTKFVELFAVW